MNGILMSCLYFPVEHAGQTSQIRLRLDGSVKQHYYSFFLAVRRICYYFCVNFMLNIISHASSCWNGFLLDSHWINVTQMHNGSSDFKPKCASCVQVQFSKIIVKTTCIKFVLDTLNDQNNDSFTRKHAISVTRLVFKNLKMLDHLASCQVFHYHNYVFA